MKGICERKVKEEHALNSCYMKFENVWRNFGFSRSLSR